MVKLSREWLSHLIKVSRAVAEFIDTTEAPEKVEVEDLSTTTDPSEIGQMKSLIAYWESDQKKFSGNERPYVDPYERDVALDRIPDVTEKPFHESHYDSLDKLKLFPKLIFDGVTETPKTSTGISNNGRDAGVVAGIVVAVISGVIILAALIAFVMYRHYVHRNVTSMNFDNPVYRKTTENQFALEQNGYAPGSKLYPSTVGEEAQEPLNTPGTNEFV